MRADIVRQAYKFNKGEKPRETIHGWTLQKKVSTKRMIVYKDENTKQIFIGVRGTADMADWAKNVKVLTHGKINLPEVEAQLEKIIATYPDYKYNVSGHSQAGTALANLMVTDPNLMEKFENVDLFNPGSGATDQDGAIQNALKNHEQVHLYLNAGDIVSNGYINDIDRERPNTYYGVNSPDFLEVHGIDQWTTPEVQENNQPNDVQVDNEPVEE